MGYKRIELPKDRMKPDHIIALEPIYSGVNQIGVSVARIEKTLTRHEKEIYGTPETNGIKTKVARLSEKVSYNRRLIFILLSLALGSAGTSIFLITGGM